MSTRIKLVVKAAGA